MNKILRISSVYPTLINDLKKKIDYKNLGYEELLKKIFDQKYSVSNNLTKNFNKKGYKCVEIINNINFLQKKWYKKYGSKKSNEDILTQQIKFYKPSIIFIANVNLISKKKIDELRKLNFIKLIFCFHCAPISKKMIKNFSNIDFILTCTEGYKKKFSKVTGKPVFLIQHAYSNETVIKYNSRKRDIDVTFIGSLFINKKLHLERIEIIYDLLKKFDNRFIAINFSNYFFIHLIIFIMKSLFNKDFYKKNLLYKLMFVYFFSNKPIFGTSMFEIFNKSKILVNMHIEDTKYAGNMRLFEGTGSGCLLLTDKKKDLKKLFKLNHEIVVYKDKDDLITKIKFFLKNNITLSRIAKNGRNKTLKSHNYEKRLNILDKIIKKNLLLNKHS
jgi:spore maturation protein CgeB